MALVLDGTNGVSGVDGTASNPAIEGTDSNTGIFYPAADTVAIGTGGTEALRVNSSQNVGIGTQSPAYKLHVSNYMALGTQATAGSGAGISMIPSSTLTNWFVGSNYVTSGAFEIIPSTAGGGSTFTTPAFMLNSSGNVGIGTSSPRSLLDLNSTRSVKVYFGTAGTIGETQTAAGDYIANNLYVSAELASITYTKITSDDGNAIIQSYDKGVVFYTGVTGAVNTTGTLDNFERARINTSGNMGIGTNSPAAKFDVVQNSASANGGRVAYFRSTASGDVANNAVIISKFDNNTTTSQIFMKFEVNNTATSCGRINANGANTAAFGSTSDRRIKENIEDLPSQLQNILALRPVEFDYIESYGGGHQIGFIAQEMQEVYPDVVSADESEEQILSITGWSKTEARLVKAIQEQQAMIEEMKAEIAALKAQP